MMTPVSLKIRMPIYFLCTSLFSVFLCRSFFHFAASDVLLDKSYAVLLIVTYGVMYQLPAMLSYVLLKKWRSLALFTAVVLSVIAHLFVFFDSHLYDLYGFHINGFVWNLLTTRGGIDSLGADQTNALLVVGYVSALVAVHFLAIQLSRRLSATYIPVGSLIIVLLLATLVERGIYGYSNATLYGPVLNRTDAIPLYQKFTMNGLLDRLGLDVIKRSKIQVAESSAGIVYPRKPIVLEKRDKPFNIIMLVSESMRWDLLTAEIMPNMERFSRQAWHFKQHYSGGNGTRQGLFSLFYGLPGNHWDGFLRDQKGPVFFDVLNDYGYQYFIYTSAKFTYPELDKTIFSGFAQDQLIENNTGEPWQRDEANTSQLIRDIQTRDPSKPFFGFAFYESTHARYSFPESSALRPDYLKALDYAGLSREDLAQYIPGMKARYENAAHGVDVQLQRVVASLQQSGDIENTLIIITGDHGEEFMERGRWGHNSAFTDWQVRTPMIVSMPNSTARSIEQRTSHMDVCSTVLTRLGVSNDVKDYSLGVDLGSPLEHRNIIVSSWTDIGLINDFGKLVIPFKSTTQHENLATDMDDKPVSGSQLAVKMQSIIFQTLSDIGRYKK
ncbi:MAG: sulfatase-like hydrolase/transferase [Gammaproteobacteria bacterium]|nr:sulfatase-like hydrolase/transferase [Gammaproteobacteria bacterium]MBQ0838733.1 sulfatase-like hydrolase/transferase [Gammaproteobacteria bacterium]